MPGNISGAIPQGTYGPGTFNLDESPIPGQSSGISFRYDASQHLDPAIIVSVVLEVSRDGGTTWAILGAFKRKGGTPKSPDGFAGATFTIEEGNQRRIRGVITITGGSVTTSANISWV